MKAITEVSQSKMTAFCFNSDCHDTFCSPAGSTCRETCSRTRADCKVRNTNPESQFWELFPGTCRIIPDVPHLLPSRAACGSQWPHIVPYPWGDHSTYCWQLWIRNCFTGREGVLGVAFSHQPRNHCFLHSSLNHLQEKNQDIVINLYIPVPTQWQRNKRGGF